MAHGQLFLKGGLKVCHFYIRKLFYFFQSVIHLKKKFSATIISSEKSYCRLSNNETVCICKESWGRLGPEGGCLRESGELFEIPEKEVK